MADLIQGPLSNDISRIRADHFDAGDWFGSPTFPVVLMPPFVESATYDGYRAAVEPIAGLDFAVEWRIVAWPRRGPRTWLQVFVDGVEALPGEDRASAVRIEAAYSDFCPFQVGVRRLRDFRLGSTVDGSLGGLSSLAYLVERPDWLRGSRVNPAVHRFVASEESDACLGLL